MDYYVTVAEGTIDEHLWAVVTAKQATLNAVLDGRSDQGTAADETSVAADLAWRLTQQGLGTSGARDPGQRPDDEPHQDRVRLDPRSTGSRTWTDETGRREALREQWSDGGAVLVTGACPQGADVIAEGIWRSWGGQVERHPADWREGRDAGMRRNAAMVSLGADTCLAFIRASSPGSSHAARLAEQAGIPVRRFRAEADGPGSGRTDDLALSSRGTPAAASARTAKGNSSAHAVRSLTAEEIAHSTRHGWSCATGKCREPVAFAARYSYVTGRSGRVSHF